MYSIVNLIIDIKFTRGLGLVHAGMEHEHFFKKKINRAHIR